jgi:integrase
MKILENYNSSVVLVNNQNEVDYGYYGDLFNTVDDKIDFISGHIQQPEIQEKLTSKIASELFVETVKKDYRVSKIKLENEITVFLSMQNSEDTKKSYLKSINDFQDYCNQNKLSFIKVSVSEVDSYINYLNSIYSSRSVRLRVASISSFFKFLFARHHETIKINPWYGRKLPKVQDKYKKDFVMKNDFEVFCNELKRLERFDILCCCELLFKYGWRIGIFENMELYEDCSWKSTGKGEIKKGRITKTELKQISNSNLFCLNFKTVSSKIKKITEKLYKQEKISCCFSAHDLRRTRILNDLKEVGGDKYLKVSKKYHKSPSTTYGYVESYLDR